MGWLHAILRWVAGSIWLLTFLILSLLIMYAAFRASLWLVREIIDPYLK